MAKKSASKKSSRKKQSVIRFGTSGWRALIARDFTFENVKLAAQATADYFKRELADKKSEIYGRKPLILVGYDARFMGKEFALLTAEIFEANGLDPRVFERDTPTPVIAFTIKQKKAIGAVNITASHNPPEYSGYKLSLWNCAGAPPEVTQQIEAGADDLLTKGWTFNSSVVGTYKCKTVDGQPAYLKRLEKLIDFEAIRKAKLKIGLEFMYGTGRGYLDTLLKNAGANVTSFHDYLNPSFGGRNPEPDSSGMEDVRQFVLKNKAHIGLGLDGDADRFGIIDKDGTWLTPNQILALALYHLKKNRGFTGAAVRTVPTSHQVDSVARMLDVKIHETPVGFKHIGALMESEPIIVGGEESGGLSIKGHVPEKDGILACLLMAELVAMEGKSLGKILKQLEKKSGEFHTTRINIRVDPSQKNSIMKFLAKGLDKIGTAKVQEFITTDGFKFLLPNEEWVAFRASGTEPVFRCYIEARSAASMTKHAKACEKLLKSI